MLPKQLPSLVPDQVPDAPAAVISLKSTSDKVAMAAAVIVRDVPIVFENTNIRLTAVLVVPSVKVPLTVWFAEICIKAIPSDDRLLKLKLLNVFAPVVFLVPIPVPVKLTL